MATRRNTQRNLRATDTTSLYFLTLFFAFAALVFLEIHTSSLGILTGKSVDNKQTLYGNPQSIRSDEFLRSSPILIGEMRKQEHLADFDKLTLGSPLDANYTDYLLEGDLNHSTGNRVFPNFSMQNLLDLDFYFISMLPLNMEFAARWWWPSLQLFLGLGLIFRAINLSWRLSFVCSLLVWSSSTVQWWSLWPVDSVGSAAMACGFLLTMVKRLEEYWAKPKNLLIFIPQNAFLLFVVGIYATRVPKFYAPWSVPVAAFFASMTLGCLIVLNLSRKTILRFLVPVTAVSVTALIPYLLSVQRKIEQISATVYPGERRFTGFADFPIWSGAASWILQTERGTGLNQSEIAIGLVVLLPISFLLIISRQSQQNAGRLRTLLLLASSVLLVCLLWAIAPWPEFSRNLYIISQIPPIRVLQILGVVTPILFILSLAFWHHSKHEKTKERKMFFAVFLITLALTLGRVLNFRENYVTQISIEEIWVTSVIASVLLALTVIRRYFKFSIGVILLVSAISVVNVNPLVQGLGIFGETETMRVLENARILDGGRWASDSFIFDSLPVGAGVRMLSGNQGLGPNKDAYRHLDPSNDFSDNWNRGGSYITFNWSQNLEISFNNPSQDIIAIVIDPCSPVLDVFELSWVVSSGDQSVHECLVPYSTIELQGIDFFVFRRI